MAEFLSTRGISYNIEQLIKSASKELIIVTPYLKLSMPIYEQLKVVSDSVRICIIYGKTDLQSNQEKLVRELNCDILFKENLHAKCYLNEHTALICSMNLHAYSEVNNYEMGVLLDAKSDKTAFDKCRSEIELISSNATKIRVIENKKQEVLEIIQYDRLKLGTLLADYLKSLCSDYRIEETDDSIVVYDCPVKNINLTTNYGIVSFEIQLDDKRCRSIKESYTFEMERLVTNDYRMFWSPPYNKIHLYWGKKLKFNSLEEEFEYCKKGIVHIIEQIRKSNIF